MNASAFTTSRHSATLFSVLLLLLSGCGDGLNLAAVTGQVTKGGQPQPKIWIEFTPIGGGRPAEARTDQQGRYELSYTGTEKGAKIGRHHVKVMSGGDVDSRDNELSPRKLVYETDVEVESGSNEFNFEIP